MNEKRLTQLKQLLSADPDDPFLVYGIAQEYLSAGNLSEAKAYFARLTTEHPSYVPTYYHYGLTLYHLGEAKAALETWRTGIPIAEKAGDRKAAAEMRELLEDLEDED